MELVMGTIRRRSTASGLDVTIDGDTEKDGKYYKCINGGSAYAVGDRVLMVRFAGTYIVIGKVGNPT